MKLLLIRHGDPDYANDALTPLGHTQARQLAETLAAVRLDAVYASPMGRAQLTAAYTARRKQMSVVTLDWLRELNGNYGASLWAWNLSGSDTFRGSQAITLENWQHHVPYGRHMQPVAAALWRSFDAFIAGLGYRRLGQGYVAPRHDDRTVAFFCHAGVILTLLSHLLHVPLPVAYAQFACDPSSRTTLRFEAHEGFGVFRLECLNDLSHATPSQVA